MYLFSDFRSNAGRFARWVMLVYRFGNSVHRSVRVPIVRQLLMISYRVLDMLIVKIAAGADIPCYCNIGPGLTLAHGGRGVVIHSNVVIGAGVTIFHQVTLGENVPHQTGVPIIGNGVLIGAGAKILGPVTIGEGALIGANAIVVHDIPAGATAVSPKATIKNRTPHLMTQ